MNTFFTKWNTYQKERFPLGIYSLLILSLTLAAGSVVQSYENTLSAFFMALGIFLLLRIADEFKDYEDDCKYRAYRAVPRGLVTLKALGILALFILTIEFLLAFKTDTLISLSVIIIYWAFMSKEFFTPKWLKKRPIVYLLSHMLIMPLIAMLLLSAQNGTTFENIPNFMALAFFNGIVLEIGRKIRQKSEEENGVETYSSLWGIKKALIIWQITLFITLLFLASLITSWPLFLLFFAFYIATIVIALKFYKNDSLKAKTVETISGVSLLLSYLIIFIDGIIGVTHG